MGHVQNSPMSTNMISNEGMIYHIKLTLSQLKFWPKKNADIQNLYFAYLWTNGHQNRYGEW